MKSRLARLASLWKLPGWFPEIAAFRSGRIRNQVRLLALAGLVGIVAGLGAIVFYVATRVVEHYALGVVAGYYPAAAARRRGGDGLAAAGGQSVLAVAAVAGSGRGRAAERCVGIHACPGGRRTRHRFGDCRLPLSARANPPARPLGQDHRQRDYARHAAAPAAARGPSPRSGPASAPLLGNLLRLRPAERRVLMAAGMGAGIGAIFRAPLAGTIFAAEVLYSSPEFEPEVIIPAGIASVISYCIYGVYRRLGAAVQDSRSRVHQSLAAGTVLAAGPVHGPAGDALHAHLLRLQAAVRPAAGPQAFPAGHRRLSDRSGSRRLVCLLAVLLPGNGGDGEPQQVLAVLAFGYSAIQDAMTQDVGVTAGILLAIALGKILTTGLTIGSGGSGGVFGPSMVIGGCGGGALGIVFHHLWPRPRSAPGQFRDRGHGGLLRRRGQDARFPR